MFDNKKNVWYTADIKKNPAAFEAQVPVMGRRSANHKGGVLMSAPLSPKQAEIYDYILRFTKAHGYPPSVREISTAVNSSAIVAITIPMVFNLADSVRKMSSVCP